MGVGIGSLLPYVVNSAVTVLILYAILRKPFRKFMYQRHEHMKDAVEAAQIAHNKAVARIAAAKQAIGRAAVEEKELLEKEKRQAEQERQEILLKAEQESRRVLAEADRLAQVEAEEASERVKEQFLDMVLRETEDSLRKGLKKDDHSAILKRAQNSIEVGV
jgi:F-type H+-transporting ATPase subunit b